MSQLDFEGSNSSDIKCAFCDIVWGKRPAYIVFQDSTFMAFLDKRPLFPGHCLLIPQKHFSTLVELDTPLIEPLFLNARMLAIAIEKAMTAEGTFIAINNKVSQSILHLHIHIVPRRKKDGLKGFFWPRNLYRDDKHIQEVQKNIKIAVSELTGNK